MQNVLLWNVDLRACSSHTSPPFRSTDPPKRSSPRGREASASVRHAATHHAAGRQTQGFLTQTSGCSSLVGKRGDGGLCEEALRLTACCMMRSRMTR